MAERRTPIDDATFAKIKAAFDHVALADPLMFGMYAVPSDGGKSAKLLEENGFTTEDIWAYTRIKLGGISAEADKNAENRLKKKLNMGNKKS